MCGEADSVGVIVQKRDEDLFQSLCAQGSSLVEDSIKQTPSTVPGPLDIKYDWKCFSNNDVNSQADCDLNYLRTN
ncbi:MAG: hypothetical protein Q9M91_08905 [Candidatus Dojkabacteria bacterium]|nr:hypothetical protein [Candidatus Dojkabacteria bacterium]MDQ7021891.1 hypothetical protein [Candidatus Dojkabacteria bacterium]